MNASATTRKRKNATIEIEICEGRIYLDIAYGVKRLSRRSFWFDVTKRQWVECIAAGLQERIKPRTLSRIIADHRLESGAVTIKRVDKRSGERATWIHSTDRVMTTQYAQYVEWETGEIKRCPIRN